MRFVRSGRLSRPGSRPSRARGPIGVAAGGGGGFPPSIPNGSAEPTYAARGTRTDTVVPITSVGGRTADDTFIASYSTRGAGWADYVCNGFDVDFSAWKGEILWQAANENAFMVVYKYQPPDGVSAPTVNLDISGSGGIGPAYHLTFKWTGANFDAVTVCAEGDDLDWYEVVAGPIGDNAFTLNTVPTYDELVLPASLDYVPANCHLAIIMNWGDNGFFGAGGWQYEGTNTTSGDDRAYGIQYYNGPGDQATDTGRCDFGAATRGCASPPIAIPGA